jgi:Alr-MurF fusion protein
MIYLNYLLEATYGIVRVQGEQTTYSAFSHDTRQLAPGEMFVAVRGVRGNGHDYLLDAIRRGATGLLVETRAINGLAEQVQASITQSGVTVVEVEDTRLALQHYASAILARWHPTVIAVAGSVGKTSTKEAIATVLSTRYPTFRSWQNYNDRLGIPLSLGRLEEQHQFAVLELGCDHPGEITDLCRMVQPQIGVLTNIQPVQLQYFGSLDRLATEQSMLLSNLPPGGYLFYNQDDETLKMQIYEYKNSYGQNNTENPGVHLHPFADRGKPGPYDISSPEVRIIHVGWDGIKARLTTRLDQENSEVNTVGKGPRAYAVPQEHHLASHLLGEHHLTTMLAAFQVARLLGMSVEEIEQALQTLMPLPGRLNPLPGILNARLLDDTHNASPASVIAGLQTLNRFTPTNGKRIAVLGDMTNLGEYEEEAHRKVGMQAASLVDYLVTRGERATLIAEAAQHAGLANTNITMTANYEDAAQAVRTILNTSPQTPPQNDTADQQRYDVVLIKGSEETRMERVTELLMARSWEAPEKLVRQTPGWKKTIFMHAERPTWVEIDLNAIASNTRHIKSLVGPQVRVLAALKADAYGHGAIKVARTVLHNGASMLGVATLSEASPLREADITAPILVFGYTPLWQMREAIRLDATVTLYSLEAAQELSRAAQDLGKTAKVHIKVDTGMGRLGIRHEQSGEIVTLVRAIQTLPGLELQGIYTHFAQADAADRTYSDLQLARFQSVIALLEELGLRPPIVHAANSAAILTMPEAHFDMVRPGIAIYGLHPSPDVPLSESFRPALSFKTQVSQVKWLPAGEGISYGSTYITTRPTRIAALPVGYADGFRRSPRNWGSVLIHGQQAPILGRVCMDQCMIDVTHIPQARSGDEVVLIGRQGDATLSAEQVAERLGTINYEVVSEILARVPRVD